MSMDIELIYKQNSSTGIIETSVLVLMENGIRKVYSENKNEPTIMSVLNIFSRERIANAIAKLCNSDIISVNYRTRGMTYTPIFRRLKALSVGLDFVGGDNGGGSLIYAFAEKCKIIREKEPKFDFSAPLRSFDLRLV